MSVKSDSPSRPGGCSCRKMTSCSTPLSARQARMRRSRVRRTPNLGMAVPDLVENGHRPQAWDALQQGHYLTVPNHGQRIATSAAARRFLLRRQPWILFDTIGGGGAEPGFGRRNGRLIGLTETHIQPHLAVGDVAAGQAAVPHRREEPASYRPTATARKRGPLRGPAGQQIRYSGRATPSLRYASGDSSSS